MFRTILLLTIFGMGCTLPEKKKENFISQKPDTTVIQSSDVNAALADTSNSIPLPAVQKIKSPNGIYQTVLPSKNKVQQTIEFNPDLTYSLEENYLSGEKDSFIRTNGTWTPSDGFVWLYKDQVAIGRYKWKGNTLQYYNPVSKKSFSMQHLQDASENTAWKNSAKNGVVLFGTGNEPFWNVELDKKDSVSFKLADWDHFIKMKVDSSFTNSDSSLYLAQNDSTQILVTIFPHFCSDGMSDFVYRNKVKVQYNHRKYSGCGILFK
jgi:uncharacterized membrane protein